MYFSVHHHRYVLEIVLFSIEDRHGEGNLRARISALSTREVDVVSDLFSRELSAPSSFFTVVHNYALE